VSCDPTSVKLMALNTASSWMRQRQVTLIGGALLALVAIAAAVVVGLASERGRSVAGLPAIEIGLTTVPAEDTAASSTTTGPAGTALRETSGPGVTATSTAGGASTTATSTAGSSTTSGSAAMGSTSSSANTSAQTGSTLQGQGGSRHVVGGEVHVQRGQGASGGSPSGRGSGN
jgi:hypothetical protein